MRRRASIGVVVWLLVLGSGLTLAYRKAYGTWWQRPYAAYSLSGGP